MTAPPAPENNINTVYHTCGSVAPTEAPRCRLRFKGIENFLRRIAFNLGNTPSQTEVKIISCIPIDVTDLQYKILTLEKELEECQHRMQSEEGAVVCSALVPPPQLPRSDNTTSQPRPPQSLQSLQSLHSLHSLIPAALSDDSHYMESFSSSQDGISTSSIPLNESLQNNLASHSHREPSSDNMPEHQNYVEHDRLRNILKAVRKIKKKRETCNTHLVYYTKTYQSPFKNYNVSMSSPNKPKQSKETISRSYLEEMIRKQYKPNRMLSELSDTSQFSSPVCRDVTLSCQSTCPYDSDLCSCCHGKFHNVDKTLHQTNDIFECLPLPDNTRKTNGYYDSSLYDLVPVKEKTTKIKKEEEMVKKKEPYFLPNDENNLNTDKKRYKSDRVKPYVVNYLTSVRSPKKSGYKRKIPIKFRKSKSRLEVINTHSTVDCSSVYMKTLHRAQTRKLPEPIVHTEMKNAECLTISINSTECQTASTKSVQLEPLTPVEDKTEETLNQIKTILQCVLTEVKTSAQTKPPPEEKLLKDAIVQKGVSQNNMQTCSSLMNSYSPYNMNPQFLPSCSRQNSQAVYPSGGGGASLPAPCLQNYPLFIQRTGRQCTCCYRHAGTHGGSATHGAPASHASTRQSTAYRRAPLVTAATNTEGAPTPTRTKETEKLIKEIYKSIAINMDYPPKDSSTSGYDDLRSSNNSKKMFDFKYEPSISKRKDTNSELSNRGTQEATTTTTTRTWTPLLMDTRVGSDATSDVASVRSQRREGLRSDRIQSYMVKKETRMASESEREKRASSACSERVGPRPGTRPPPEPGTRVSDSDRSDTNDTDSDSDATVMLNNKPLKSFKKKEKSGLFSKMVKLFKSKSKKTERVENDIEFEEEEESESDSDDYQTVYSQQIKKKHVHYEKEPPRGRYKRKSHSKISNTKRIVQRQSPNERPRCSPYMEQEYRRHWNEDIAFHGGYTPQYSSDLPMSRDSMPHRAPPQYYQAYEARNAFIDQRPMEANHIVRNNAMIEAPRGPNGPIDPREPTGPSGLSRPNGPNGPSGYCGPSSPSRPNGPKGPRGYSGPSGASRGLSKPAWLKKPKIKIACGPQWKKYILES